MNTDWQLSGCFAESIGDHFLTEADSESPNFGERIRVDRSPSANNASITVAEFVERKFIPEYVRNRRTATKLYFQAILKYIVTPGRVARAFGNDSNRSDSEAAQHPSSW